MFSHIMLGSNDLKKSLDFYDAVLGALGIAPGVAVPNKPRYVWSSPAGRLVVTTPLDGQCATHGNGSTIGFVAQSTQQIDTAHAAGVAAGGTSIESPPGWRGEGAGRMYLAYLRDPTGNKICLFHRSAAV